MPTVHALFDSYVEATEAVNALEARGIPGDDISVIANKSDNHPEQEPNRVAEGAELGADLGAVAGGAGGLLAGLGIVTLPGIGPVLAGGWLVTTMLGFFAGAATGLAAGSIVGALTQAGVPQGHAELYAEGLKRGGTLVTARVPERRLAEAEAVFDEARRVDVGARRQEYASGGWSGSLPAAPR
jgi:hypothetical protein